MQVGDGRKKGSFRRFRKYEAILAASCGSVERFSIANPEPRKEVNGLPSSVRPTSKTRAMNISKEALRTSFFSTRKQQSLAVLATRGSVLD